MDGRVVVITGPTSGIGRVVALQLAARGAELILVGRSRSKCEAVRAEVRDAGGPPPHVVICDLSEGDQVDDAVGEILALDRPIHVLLNNAGLMSRPRVITGDGLELTMAVSYFSAFQLTLGLVERMKQSASADEPCRIINTTSDTYPIGRLDLDDLTFEKGYGPIRSYAASKLAAVLFTRTLARRLQGTHVTANVYNPTMIYTSLAVGNHAGALVRVGDFFWSRIAKPLDQGWQTPVHLAVSPEVAQTSGALFANGKQLPIKKGALDTELGDALWSRSEALTYTRWAGEAPPRPRRQHVRVGILGAARIAPTALLKHARPLAGVTVVAVAEEYQSAEALQSYADLHQIPRRYTAFDDLLADPDVDAVYVALPISMHAEWTLRAIAASKHVLCEKPLASNAEEARRVHEAARKSDLVVCEAMHFRHHPLVDRVKEILASGEIGALRDIDASFSAFMPFNDFRFNYALGGGCTIDMGCYPIGFLRAVTGIEPQVESAQAGLHGEHIDRYMIARLRFTESCTAKVYMGMRSSRLLSVSMKLTGTLGSIRILNFIKPEVYHRLVITTPDGKRREHVEGGSTYGTQLAAFVHAVRTGDPVLTSTDDAVLNMTVIDAVYRASGLPPRGRPQSTDVLPIL